MAKKTRVTGGPADPNSNEEPRSLGQDPQSFNNGPSRHELRSANIALQTANTALDVRLNDLVQANSDLRNLFESTHIATVFLDNDLRVRGFTPPAIHLFNLSDADIGRSLRDVESPMSYPELDEDVRSSLAKVGMVERGIAGKRRHFLARIHPYRSTSGDIAGAVLNFIDVTSTVKAEEALRKSEAQLRTLLAELQHRVRNTLAVVKSITQRTADASSTVEEMAAHLAGRLDAFARVQSAVTRNPNSGVDLKGIIADELLVHASREGDHFAIGGPDVALKPKAAESVSLAVHELTTNAVKHGALTKPDGRIQIDWKLNGDGTSLAFEWAETGLAGKKIKPSRHGFGMELLTQILPYDLDAKTKVDFGREGVRFSMDLPLNHLVQQRGGGRRMIQSRRRSAGDSSSGESGESAAR